MSALVQQGGSQYSDEQRREAATLYAIHGVDTKVSELTGIPRKTVNQWRKSEWWHDVSAEIRHQISDRHTALYHRVTDTALTAALERIDEATPQQLVTMAAISTDKARLLSNQPTSIRGDSSTISDLANQFAKLSEQWEEKQSRVISTQNQADVQTKQRESVQDDQ